MSARPTNAARREAAARVAAMHRPLAAILGDLRREAGDPQPPPPEPEAVPREDAGDPQPPAPAPEPEAVAQEEAGDPQPPVSVVGDPPPPSMSEPEAAVAAAFSDALAELVTDMAAGSVVRADDIALRLAVAAEESLGAAVLEGAQRARAAGVPGAADVTGAGLDVTLDGLATYAREIHEALAGGEPERAQQRVAAAARRMTALAHSAGVAAAVAGAGEPGWILRQRFGAPFCPNPACYGHDWSVVTPEIDGLPPYADDCNCQVEPTR